MDENSHNDKNINLEIETDDFIDNNVHDDNLDLKLSKNDDNSGNQLTLNDRHDDYYDNKLIKTAYFNSNYIKDNVEDSNFNKNNVLKSSNLLNKDNEVSYLKVMEENTKLFEIKMKKLSDKNSPIKNKESRFNNVDFNIVNFLKKENSFTNDNNINKKESSSEIFMAKNNIEIEKLKNELFYKDMLLVELNDELEEFKNNKIVYENEINSEYLNKNNELNNLLHKYLNEIEFLQKENIKNNIVNKKISEENENLKYFTEGLKKENVFLKTSLIKKDGENSLLLYKLSEIEKEKIYFEKKLSNEDSKLKILKIDYENLTKNLNKIKKQLDSLSNKYEETKAENYNLKQENSDNKRTNISDNNFNRNNYASYDSDRVMNKTYNYNNNVINKSMGELNYIYGNENSHSNYYSNTNNNLNENNNFNDLQFDKKLSYNNNDEIYYPSEVKLKEGKNELNFIDKKLSELMTKKLNTENELFKLPDRPRTMNEINKKRSIEESLNQLENEINEIKMRIRKLNGK